MIPLNQDGQRLDFYLKPPNTEHWTAYTHRAKIHKLCNDYQLSGQCSSGDRCHYDHSHLEPELKHVLKLIVHDYPCGRRGSCRLKNCNLGHVCYREGCKGSSGKGGCRLNRAMHGIDPNVSEWVSAVVPHTNGWNGSSVADTDDMISERGGADVGTEAGAENGTDSSTETGVDSPVLNRSPGSARAEEASPW